MIVSQKEFVRNGHAIVEVVKRVLPDNNYQVVWRIGGATIQGASNADEGVARRATEEAFNEVYK